MYAFGFWDQTAPIKNFLKKFSFTRTKPDNYSLYIMCMKTYNII